MTTRRVQTRRKAFAERGVSLPADLAHLPEARDFVDRAAAEFGFDDERRAQIKLATNEAVANAIEHGSPPAGADVRLRAAEEDGALAIYVTDAGMFVPRTLRRGELPERGRGMAFMGIFMDEVDVRPGPDGTEVRLLKRLAP